MKITFLLLCFLCVSCQPNKEAQIDETLGYKPDAYPTGAFFVEMGNENFTPTPQDTELIEKAKISIKPLNKLLLDHHIYFLIPGENPIVKVDKIWGYKDGNPIHIYGDTYSLRKVDGQVKFETIKPVD